MKKGQPIHLVAWGATHKTAPEELRERLAVPEDKLTEAYECIQSGTSAHECMLVNTCNRIEIYAVGKTKKLASDLAHNYADYRGLAIDDINGHGFHLHNHEAIQHLFSVASGIDSLMIGENEILGQLKNSYSHAQQINALGPGLNRGVQKSFQQAKWARTHTGIAKGQTSIGMVCVELANRIHGTLKYSRILVLGSGEVAEKTVEALHGRGARDITISSRTYANARRLDGAFGGSAIEFQHFRDKLINFDIIISSTSANETVIKHADIEKALKKRGGLPYFLIDLAMPRDVDASLSELDDIYLYDLTDLANIANENLKSRMEEVERLRFTLAAKAEMLWKSIHQRFRR